MFSNCSKILCEVTISDNRLKNLYFDFFFQFEARLSCTTLARPSPSRPRSLAPSARSASATRNPRLAELSEHTPALQLTSKLKVTNLIYKERTEKRERERERERESVCVRKRERGG
jgi:hypothetical protein